MKSVAFVTYSGSPGLTGDDALAARALADLGVTVDAVAWDEPGTAWEQYDAAVLRSTWDYHTRLDDFLAWLDDIRAAEARVLNPPDVVRWNCHKRYLLDLQRRGVPIVPTAFVARDRTADLAWILDQHGWNKAVIKPAVSASARNTWMTDRSTAGRDQAKLAGMMLDSDVLVQGFLPEVIREGEFSLIFFDKRFSHCVQKKPRQGDFRTQPEFGGRGALITPVPRLIAQAQAVLDLVPRPLLYARVDGVVRDGVLLLMELELIEPDLLLSYAPAAPQAFASAIHSAIERAITAPGSAAALLGSPPAADDQDLPL